MLVGLLCLVVLESEVLKGKLKLVVGAEKTINHIWEFVLVFKLPL
jgi:hypothetical protein